MTEFRGFTLSLIIHMALAYSLMHWDELMERFPLLKPEPSAVLLSLKKQSEPTQIVILDTPPLEEIEDSKKAPFLAANRVRVKEQAQARFTGDTQNREFPTPQAVRKRAQQADETPKTTTDGELIANKSRDKQTSSVQTPTQAQREFKNLPMGISTLGESLPTNIKHGDFTFLNTDQSLFFSFYSRITPRVRFHWNNYVESVIESLTMRNLKITETKIFTTEVDVILDKAGYYQRTDIFRSSGITALDQAVVLAFENSAPFVNPPQGMVQDDGLIHIRGKFQVHFTPQMFAKPSR